MTKDDKAMKLIAYVKKFITDQNISCAEKIWQDDDIVLNAPEFIEDCCKIVGYCKD